jgi:hypothetical protein
MKQFTIISIFLLIVNLAVGYNIYWANLHSHTSLSDGNGWPAEAYAYARDTANIDVLSVTDHTSYLNQGSYDYEKTVANQFTVPGQFVAIAGQEFGNLSAFGHFSIFDADSLCPVSVSNLDAAYAWIYRHHSYTQMNHPALGNFNYLAYNHDADKYVAMIEVVNGSGLYTPFYEDRFIEALNLGWHIMPVSNQDNHNRHWGDAMTAQGQIPLTGVWADSLTKENILDALNKRRMYACEVKPANDRINLREFSIDGKLMGDVYTSHNKTVSIKVSADAINNFDTIYLYKNGVVYKDTIITQNNFTWSLTDNISNDYYFVKGVQQDGDNFWSSPIWVIYQAPPMSIQAWPNPIRSSSLIKFPKDRDFISSDMFVYTMEGNLVFKQYKWYSDDQVWDGQDQNGTIMKNGIYYVVINARTARGTEIYKGKVALLKP